MTIADAAVEILAETDNEGVAHGDCGLLDAIAVRAGMKRVHPVHRHKRVLDAVGRDPRFIVRYFKIGRRWCRCIWLRDSPYGRELTNQ